MASTHHITCDRCETTAELRSVSGFLVRPRDWCQTRDWGKDLCPNCFKKYRVVHLQFMNTEIDDIINLQRLEEVAND